MELTAALLVLFAVAIGTATFLENDYGTLAARQMVYNAKWFELLLLIIGINLVGSIVSRKLYLKEKLTIFLFHLAFIVILLGSAITRYFGYEGNMHIREGESSNLLQREGAALQVWVDQEENPAWIQNLSYTNLARVNIQHSVQAGDEEIRIRKTGYIPNAAETVVEDPAGQPVLSILLMKPRGREQVFLEPGDSYGDQSFSFSFDDEGTETMVRFRLEEGRLRIVSDSLMYLREMTAPADSLLLPGIWHDFRDRAIYRVNNHRFVLQQFYPAASIRLVPAQAGSGMTGMDALQVRITAAGFTRDVDLFGKQGLEGQKVVVPVNGHTLSLVYGSQSQTLPFSVFLHDFQIERYPGSNSPSSYASEVTLVDRANGVEKDFRIYMNNILKYAGYRFYQSSYDQDEKGTILSVNHDIWGTRVTYLGYFLLVAGMVVTLFTRHSRFRQLIRRSRNPEKKSLKSAAGLFLLLLVSSAAYSQPAGMPSLVDKETAREFGRVLVQDRQGRIEPVNTLATDIVHKVTRRDRFEGLHPMQVFLGMHQNPAGWQTVKMIKISNPELKEFLGVSGSYAAFTDFFDFTNRRQYKLASDVDEAYSKSPGQRTKFDKEIIDVDERVNICYMIYIGQFLKIFPRADDPAHTWYTSAQAGSFKGSEDSVFVAGILNLYFNALDEGIQSGNYSQADELLNYIHTFQHRNATIDLPGSFRVQLEIMYYEWNVFKRLFPFYGLVGFFFLLVLLVHVVVPRFPVRIFSIGAQSLLFLGFVLHTLGLAARWYISGHAPWSNGFESMIYVAWATMLAGFLFAKRSPLTLAATSVLATLTLFVAHLSWMNPEITNLVPVLKSYWLTLHVSVITASYGFLGLGAILGLVNMVLFLLKTGENHLRIRDKIRELTNVSEISVQLGLVFLTTGTLLGAVWANESWGRYWGWDPKETWSLVTILVYTFITHMRLIPGMKSDYNFNLAGIVGFSSVLMTYFGVNYYLSGLHSYAKGDPVPVPSFVYVTVILISFLALAAWFNAKRFREAQPEPGDQNRLIENP